MSRLVIRLLLPLLIFLSSAYAAEDAVKALGTSKSDPIDRSFFFKNGKYVHSPYIVERRGVDIYINDELVRKGPEWPPYDYRVSEDPGEPPADSSPLDPVPPGVDGRDTYWAKKARFVFQHYDEATARRMMVDLYRRCPRVTVQELDSTSPDHVTLIDEHGRPLLIAPFVPLHRKSPKIPMRELDSAGPDHVTLIDEHGRPLSVALWIPPQHSGAPASRETVLANVERSRGFCEQRLSGHDAAVFELDGAEVALFGDRALNCLAILLSSAPVADKVLALESTEAVPKEFSQKILAGFQPDAQLTERYNALVKARDAAKAAKNPPPRVSTDTR